MAKKAAPAEPASTSAAAAPAAGVQEGAAAAPAPVVQAEGRRSLSEDEKLAAVADLLSGKASGGGDEDSGDSAQAGDGEGEQGAGQQDGGEGGGGVADEDDAAAEAAGEGKKAPARDDAFYAQEVALPDGDVVTIGELKDAYAQRQASELAMTEREGKVARQIGEAHHLAEALREHVPPQYLQGAAQELDQRISREAAALLEIYPAWKQETARQADHGLVLDMVSRLAGGQGTAIYHKIAAFLDQPTDREVMQVLVGAARVLGQASKRQRELERVRAEKPAARHAAPARPSTELDKLTRRAKETRRAEDQVRAVEALLR